MPAHTSYSLGMSKASAERQLALTLWTLSCTPILTSKSQSLQCDSPQYSEAHMDTIIAPVIMTIVDLDGHNSDYNNVTSKDAHGTTV